MTNQTIPSLPLSNGLRLPQLVFGVYQIKDPKTCQKAVEDALVAGYRAIDTAASYGNEAAVGAALKATGIKRNELFVTTKLWVEDASEEGTKRAIDRSLELLSLDSIDLYLIHQPVGDIWGAWREMTRSYEKGVLKAIGVSNFAPDRLMDFALQQKVKPMVNQIEINPFCQQKKALPLIHELGMLAQAWAPFAEGKNQLFTHPVLSAIANKHHKTIAQVVLRMVIQLGACAISKTLSAQRMCENLNIYDFELDRDDMMQLASLDTQQSQFFSHQDPEIIRWFLSRHIEH